MKTYAPPLCIAAPLGIPGNPDCRCLSPLAAFFCHTGHMMECHYPLSCEEAECSHWQRDVEQDDFEPPDGIGERGV